MRKKIRLLKSWMGHKKGTELEVEQDIFEDMEEGTAEEITTKSSSEGEEEEEEETQENDIVTKAVDAATKAVEKTLKKIAKGEDKSFGIRVHDKSDDDPFFGYLPGFNGTVKEVKREQVAFAFGRFCVDVKKAHTEGRLSETLVKCKARTDGMVTKAAGEGLVVNDDEAGGFMIFSAATQLINQSSLESSIVRPRANKVTMATQLLRIPYLRDDSHASGIVYGGIKIYFDDELEQSTESKIKLKAMEFKLKKMTALGFASEEWMKWSPVSLGSWLIPKFGEAIGFKEDLCFLVGKGGGQPLGALNASCKVTITKEAGQAAGTFVMENSAKMIARLKKRKAGSIIWLMNQTVFPQLPLFNIAAGTGGAPVFTNNVGDAPGQKLWGFPIEYSEKVPALGSAGAVNLIDLSDYTVADDQTGPEVAQSMHLKFDYGQTAFRITKYIDGQNETAVAFQPLNGDTLSPVVQMPA